MKAAKRTLWALASISVVVTAGLLAFLAYGMLVGPKLDHSSKIFVDRVVPEIVDSWSADKLMLHASSELSKTASKDQVDAAFRAFSKLGSLEKYAGSTGKAKISISPQAGRVVTAEYLTTAAFKNGEARIRITLLQKDGNWQIVGFFVEPIRP